MVPWFMGTRTYEIQAQCSAPCAGIFAQTTEGGDLNMNANTRGMSVSGDQDLRPQHLWTPCVISALIMVVC